MQQLNLFPQSGTIYIVKELSRTMKYDETQPRKCARCNNWRTDFKRLKYGTYTKTCLRCLKQTSDYQRDNLMFTKERRATAKRIYRKTPRGAMLKAISQFRSNQESPEKAVARVSVNTAKKNGTLIIQPCEICQSTIKIEAHHPDYNKPLMVVWLCKLHHTEIHHQVPA